MMMMTTTSTTNDNDRYSTCTKNALATRPIEERMNRYFLLYGDMVSYPHGMGSYSHGMGLYRVALGIGSY